jgi:ribonuclease D
LKTDYKFIQTTAAWRDCVAQLKDQPRLAIDLEANSMYVYQEEICLVQISIPGSDFIVDPLALPDLDGLGPIIENNQVEKVFHAAEYDLMLLKREYGWQLQNLFDTMWAARILGYQKFGLANILAQFFQVKLNKRFQRADWGKRPLSDAQLRYAQADTHYLLPLRDQLWAELVSAGRQQEALEIFAGQCRIKLPDTSFDPDGFWRLNGAQGLSPTQMGQLQALYLYRDEEARKRNQPHFKIFSDQTMLQLVYDQPRALADLRQIQGMTSAQIQRYGRRLLAALEQGTQKIPRRPVNNRQRVSDAMMERYERLHNWRKQTAEARGVESDVIISRDALWAIAKANPSTLAELEAVEGLGPWRLNEYADDILTVLRKH